MKPLILFLIAWPLFCHAADPAPKMAASARMDIIADEAVGKLDSGEITNGKGEIGRENWLTADRIPASYSVQFPITHIAWRELGFAFTPEHDGNVTVSLLGPWEAAADGKLIKEEVLWSNFSRNEKSLSFDGWQGDAPVNGEPEVARAWHNSRKEIRLAVKGGTPVKLAFEARAATPQGFQEMARLRNNTPAHRSIAHFRHGVNFGNYLEVPRNQDWGVNYSEQDFKAAAREGFDHIRIPMRWNDWTGPAPAFEIEKAFYEKCDFMVTNTLNNHLNVIVNLHHFDPFYKDPQAEKPKLLALWKQISEHYKNFSPDHVAFEILNEPMDKATTEVMNPILAEAIQVVRKACPSHTIFVGPGRWNSVSELGNLKLPANESNLVVTVHCYDPYNFTHQGASWSGPKMGTKGVKFPGPPETPLEPAPAAKSDRGIVQWIERYNTTPRDKNPSSPGAFEDKIQIAREWSLYYGRPVHFGEFGAIVNADDTSRANWYREFRTRLEASDLAWAIWDWKAGFAYWDSSQNRPHPGIKEALFGVAK